MGITVSPPDVNASSGRYKILEDKVIVTGISAIKGVGEKAILEIIKNQPYESFASFLAKNNSRTVGKTVIQSLSKSGALDPFKRTRKDMCENYQKYRSKVKAALKKENEAVAISEYPGFKKFQKEEKQRIMDEVSLTPADDKFVEIVNSVSLPESEDEWSRRDLLLSEKEVMGSCISGSLHEVFKSFFSGGEFITKLSSINSLEANDKVKIEVIIKTKIKEFKIKNGKNIGRKFAKYLVEDINGDTCGMTVWADDYDRYRTILKDGIPIKAICRVNSYLDQKDLALSALERVYGR
jgi:DNA polymerase-3 subunit alpha